MPPRDPRLCPDLERALPADSDRDPPGYRIVREVREVLFGDGQWNPVTVRAAWNDRHGRSVVMAEWSIGGEGYREAYIWDRERVREA